MCTEQGVALGDSTPGGGDSGVAPQYDQMREELTIFDDFFTMVEENVGF